MKNIVETAIAAGQFKTLVAAVEAAGLVETLKAGHYTVLRPRTRRSRSSPPAPSKACSRICPGCRASWSYHVVPGKVLPGTLPGSSPPKPQGGERASMPTTA